MILAVYRAELLFLRRWPAAWVLVLLPAAALVLTRYLTQYLFYRTAGGGTVSDIGSPLQLLYTMSPSQAFTLAVGAYGAYAAVPVLILGALVTGSDWGNGHLKTALTQGPSRVATGIGQALAVLTAAAAGVTALFLATAASSAAIALLEEDELPSAAALFPGPSLTVKAVAIALLINAVYASAGLLLGTVFRSAGAAVAAALVWIVGVQVLFATADTQLGGAYAAVNNLLPNSAAVALSSALGPVVGVTAEPRPSADVSSGAAAVLLAMYLFAFLAPNSLLLARRDVR